MGSSPTTRTSRPVGRSRFYGRGEFESPTRSTIPLLSLLIHDPTTLHKIAQDLGMPGGYSMCLEYQVRSPHGRGNASQTDLMLRGAGDALAIEAKWTEPVGPTVRDWLDKGKQSRNYHDVLQGWLELLQPRSSCPLKPADFLDVRYQMLHRAASAAATRTSPRLAYFLFHLEGISEATTAEVVHAELDKLWAKLGRPEGFPFAVVEVTLTALEPYEPLRNLPKRSQDTATAVIAALNGPNPLFRFEDAQLRPTEPGQSSSII